MLNVQLIRTRAYARGFLLVLFMLSTTLAFAQNRVTGKVTDKSGEPLIGVNVLEIGTIRRQRQMCIRDSR